jgi:hypothetical protein
VNTRPPTPLNAAQREALEARFALRLSARLEEGAQLVPHDISERLRVAREQALRAARDVRVKTLAPVVTPPVLAPDLVLAGSNVGGVSLNAVGGLLGAWNESANSRQPGHGRRLDDAPVSWRWRLASALPMLALAAGLWGVHLYTQHEQVQAATEVDMALLTDDLPPAAYADPGFEAFLSNSKGEARDAQPKSASDIDVSLDAPATEDAAPAVPSEPTTR